MDHPDDNKPIEIPLDMLTDLYDHDLVELVHAISDVETCLIRVTIRDKAEPVELKVPGGSYLLIRVVGPPTPRRGLFAVQDQKYRGQV